MTRSDVYQQSFLAAPLRVSFEMMPQRLVNLHDAAGDVQVSRMLQQSRLPLSGQDRLRTAYMSATRPLERQNALMRAEEEAVHSVAESAGMAVEEIEHVLGQARKGRAGAEKVLRSRVYDGEGRSRIHFTDDADGVTHELPLLVSQEANVLPMVDMHEVRRAATRIGRYRLRHPGTEIPSEMLDFFYRAWRPAVLLRLGWPIRILADEQLRIFAKIGALAQVRNLASPDPAREVANTVANFARRRRGRPGPAPDRRPTQGGPGHRHVGARGRGGGGGGRGGKDHHPRLRRFEPEDTAPDRLAHGYAVTVHRSQGATVDAAHLFADGGGRELGYVGMSRAREASQVWVVADDVDQAVEDLTRDWAAERRQRWAIDSGTPATSPLAVEGDQRAPAPVRTALRRARLQAERDAIAAAVPPDRAPAVRAQRELQHLRQQRLELDHGRGRWEQTPAGQAARALREAEAKRRQAEEFAAMADMGWRVRRAWRADARAWRQGEAEAAADYERLTRPHLERLDAAIAGAAERLDEQRADVERHGHWQAHHPEVSARLAGLEARIRMVDHEPALERALERDLAAEPRHPGVGRTLDDGLELTW